MGAVLTHPAARYAVIFNPAHAFGSSERASPTRAARKGSVREAVSLERAVVSTSDARQRAARTLGAALAGTASLLSPSAARAPAAARPRGNLKAYFS